MWLSSRGATALFLSLAQATCNVSGAIGGGPVEGLEDLARVDWRRTFASNVDFEEGEMVGVSHHLSNELALDTDVFVFETPYIWVPLFTLNKVARVDTKTAAVVTIPLVLGAASCVNPSRTTVDLSGGVWLGCRGTGESPSRYVFHVTRDAVVDRVLAGGWAPRAVALDAEGHLWVGSSHDGTVWEFDPATNECIVGETTPEQKCRYPAICLRPDQACGSVLRADPNEQTHGGTYPYGAMVDQAGYLWIKGGMLYKIDARHPTGADEEHAAHGLLWSTIAPPSVCQSMYGMTVDLSGDIWVGGSWCNDVKRFDGATGAFIGVYPTDGDHLARGVAVDRDGNIWVANSNMGQDGTTSGVGSVTQFDHVTGAMLQRVVLEALGKQVLVTTGVGVDAYGNIWAMGSSSNVLFQFNPLNPNERRAIEMEGPMYTYSDMLGTALRTVTARKKVASWSVVVDGHSEKPVWQEIEYVGRTPAGAELVIGVRCAVSVPALAFEPWHLLNSNPDVIPCPQVRYLAVRVQFITNGGAASPVLDDLTVRWRADPM
jgi:DNA-binding beta-propeller fold protein YncE